MFPRGDSGTAIREWGTSDMGHERRGHGGYLEMEHLIGRNGECKSLQAGRNLA